MSKYARLLREHLESEKPKLYRKMEANGTLEPWLENKDMRACEQISNLTKGGMGIMEAEELIWDELMTLP